MKTSDDPAFVHWKDKAGKPPAIPTPDLKDEFLRVLEESGDTVRAASAIDIEHGVVWRWRTLDEVFAKRWDEIVREKILPVLEAEAVRRACRNSDPMLMFLLKAYNRERYDDAVARLKHIPKGSGIQLLVTDVDGTDLLAARDQVTDRAISSGTLREDDLEDAQDD